MNSSRRVLLNSAALGSGQIIAQLANFFFIVQFARAFGTEIFGAYAFAMAVAAFLAVFVSFGSRPLAAKTIARNPGSDRELLGALIPIQLLFGFLMLVAIAGVAGFWFGSRVEGLLLFLLALHHVGLKWSGLLMARYQGRELMAHMAGVEAITALLRLGLGTVLIWLGHGPAAVVCVYPLATLLLAGAIWFDGSRHYGAIVLKLNYERACELYVASRPYFAIVLVDVLYQRVGILLLSILAVPAVVGQFAAAERLVMSLSVLHTMFVSPVFPTLSRLAGRDERGMQQVAARFLRLLLLVTLPAAALLHVFSAPIIELLFGIGYSSAAAVLQVLAWALVLRGLNGYLSTLAMATDRQAMIPKARLAALLVLLLGGVALIHALGAVGLGFALILSESFLIAAYCVTLRRQMSEVFLLQIILPIAAACLIPVLVDHLFMQDLSLLLRLILVPGMMAGAMAIVGAVRLHDLRFLREMILRTG
jgi:polysaccharide transporter, PST family